MSDADRAEGHVFISYVREDSARVDRLRQILEHAGIPAWRDSAKLWPGQDWRLEIRRAITGDALVFLACFSLASGSRRTSYQNEELTLAIARPKHAARFASTTPSLRLTDSPGPAPRPGCPARLTPPPYPPNSTCSPAHAPADGPQPAGMHGRFAHIAWLGLNRRKG